MVIPTVRLNEAGRDDGIGGAGAFSTPKRPDPSIPSHSRKEEK